ncbi:MAG TPA: tRNA (N6-isopentenyl adenosine(37)-C2)-methylthiotransferase MiaB [Chloroflexota bacterium]
MRNFHIWSIGCQMNAADARRLTEELEVFGLEAAEDVTEADLVVLYSCMVRQSAENRVHGQLAALRRLKERRPWLRICLAGCVGDVDFWKKRYPFVDVIIPPTQELSVRDRILDLLDLDERYRLTPADGVRAPGISEGITIHQGCNRSCTYCIVPFTRGRERSRPPEAILRDVEALVARGTREVVLLSQIVDRYGRDLDPPVSLAELLAMLDKVPGLLRIRFLTSYPLAFRPEIIEAVASLPKVCEDINLPVQAGDDEVLRRMRRGYTVAMYRDLVRRIRERIPEVGLSTDIIVGFPGETEEQFQRTLDLLREVRFDVVHVARFSPRRGTVAAEWPDDVPLEEKKRRLRAVEDLQCQIAAEINAGLVGRRVEVLVEGRDTRGNWFGRTRTNKLVHFAHPDDLTGQLVWVTVTKSSPWSLQGEVAEVAASVA